MTINNLPDGEYFVDTPVDPVAPRSQWHGLSLGELLEVRRQLQARSWGTRGTEVSRQLEAMLAELETIISRRINA